MADRTTSAWPFEMVPRERWERLTERQKGWVEGVILSELQRFKPAAPTLRVVLGGSTPGMHRVQPTLQLVSREVRHG